jgi:hypothetical protein
VVVFHFIGYLLRVPIGNSLAPLQWQHPTGKQFGIGGKFSLGKNIKKPPKLLTVYNLAFQCSKSNKVAPQITKM